MSWKATDKLMDSIRHYANFPATGVSLRQMVQFGERPSQGKMHARYSCTQHVFKSLLERERGIYERSGD